MSLRAVLFLLALIAAGWEAIRTRSPGWAGVALIAAGLLVEGL